MRAVGLWRLPVRLPDAATTSTFNRFTVPVPFNIAIMAELTLALLRLNAETNVPQYYGTDTGSDPLQMLAMTILCFYFSIYLVNSMTHLHPYYFTMNKHA